MHDRLQVIALWSPPGCRATGFERMMIDRGDLTVLHEPFTKLALTGRYSHEGRLYGTATALLESVLERAERPGARPVLFTDSTALRHPDLLMDTRFTSRIQHTFLIRDPAEVIAAHRAGGRESTSEAIGFGNCWEIFELARMASGAVPVVLDAADLPVRPAEVAASYAMHTGLPPAAGPGRWTMEEEWLPAGTGSLTELVLGDPHLAELYADQLPYHAWLSAHRLELEPVVTG
ncbi:sulfotransferase family protein [Streptomyces venezuelae]|uniref:Sulfotransferase family protein n=1 Tax=Streptomyces venezuelae TaxID=54571 RepID=A0A5P2CZJ2_STRVZ|nr:sulfotransferase family protein [Streptomyces venezuelae]QES48316.1 sulfotransferase family protein [Streptomyces venezuelae]